jgi:phage terminase large subunit-like protein
MQTPTQTLTITLPRPHPGQVAILSGRRRFNVACCGRRFGKTALGVDRLVTRALRGLPVAWFSPSYRMLTEVWRDIRRVVAPAVERTDSQQHRLDLFGGGVIEMWSLDQPDAARGRKYALVVVDEAAMVRHLEDAWSAVLRPTLVDYRGGAWFLSTPKGLNYFKRLFDLGADPAMADWASWQMPTLANPHIPADEVEAARLLLPERTYSQEFLAQFLEDGGGVFRRIRDAATATPQERAQEGHRYVIGVDWGKLEDFTVLCVVDATTREVVCLDRFNKIDYAVQTGRLHALCERFTPDQVYAEQNSMGVPLVETLQRMNLPVYPFLTTNASKLAVIDTLALSFERGEIRIPDDPVLLGELLAYEAERLPSGTLRYGAPPGQHDDCVMALALAWQGAQTAPVAWY